MRENEKIKRKKEELEEEKEKEIARNKDGMEERTI
jgi:hypothetical protein